MKSRHEIAYSKSFSSLIGRYIFLFLVNLTFGIITVCLIYIFRGVLYYKILLALSAFLLATVLFLLSWKYLARINFRLPFFNNIFEGLSYFIKQKKLIIVLSIINFLCMLVLAARFYFAYRAIGVYPSFWAVVVIANIVLVSFIASITPADLGVREIIITVVSGAVGLNNINGALVSLIDRGLGFIITFSLGFVFTAVLFKDLRRIKAQGENIKGGVLGE